MASLSQEPNRHVEVLVIGAGASGIGAAIALLREGLSFVVLEKAETLGGTWRDNTYPGCACDVPSALYSYSFAPNPEWTRAFAGQPEIRAYLEGVARTFDVTPHIRFGVEVRRAFFRASDGRWHVETSRGTYTANALIAAAGPWHEPKIPAIPGLNSFPGEVFHSARWNHAYDLSGKRVAVVGSGASAVQFVPELAKTVQKLHLFQRTAQWVLPKPDHYVPRAERWLMRTFPKAQKALRAVEYGALEGFGVGFRKPWILEQVQRIGRFHLERAVKDPVLRKKLTPDYTLGCKRLLMSNAYYPALTRPNVEVLATEVKEFVGSRVVGADGSAATVDAVIFGTGFHILDMPVAKWVFDAHGKSLSDHWKGSPVAYLGTTVAGFPNFFLLLGPSLGTGHSSAFTILEAQIAYVMDGLRKMRRERVATVDVRPEVMAAYHAEVQEALGGTVYVSGGCTSYYLDSNGKNTFNWPWSTPALERRIHDFDLDAYAVTHARTASAIGVPAETATSFEGRTS